jgi:myo-inositol-1(or 4)-monophosphatase
MNDIDLETELKVAKSAALAAGEILKTKKSDLNVETFSSERDIKLEADVVAETLIKEIIQDESNIPILAEESGKSSENLGDIFWVIDPLDGTANYSRNIPICCVSIALIKNLIPVIGVIYDFNNNDMYIGSSEQEAMLNDKKISVSQISKKHDGILVTGLPNATDYSDQAMINMVKDFQGWRKVRMIGSAAMASAYVASGKADVYKELGTYLWDVAAGAAIVNAAGGTANILNQKDNFQVDVFFYNSKISD